MHSMGKRPYHAQASMIGTSFPKAQNIQVSWQDHGKCGDSEGVIHVDFLPHGLAITAQYYNNLLHSDDHQAVLKDPGNRQRSSYCMITLVHIRKIWRWQWAEKSWPPPSGFRLFASIRMHLGQKFQTDDKIKRAVLNWLSSQDRTFYAAGISNLSGWVKCVSVKGEYLEKEWEFGDSVMCRPPKCNPEISKVTKRHSISQMTRFSFIIFKGNFL
jgi:hypothetical protein